MVEFKSFFKPPKETADEKRKRKRDRYGWRTAKKDSRHGGLTAAGEKARRVAHENTVKAETRAKVWLRSAVCEACGDTEDETARKWWKREHEMNETIPRARTKNRPAEERFNTEICNRLCVECHRLFHKSRLEFEFHSPLRCDGPVTPRFKK